MMRTLLSPRPQWSRLVASIALCLSILVWPMVAQGQAEISAADRSAARNFSVAAFEQYQGGRYTEALEGFKRAHALVRLPTTGIWLARCLKQLNRWVEAADQYVRVAHMKPEPGPFEKLHRKAIRDASREHAELEPTIPKLTVKVSGQIDETIALEIDGRSISRPLWGMPRPTDPGEHQVVLKRAGTELATTGVRLQPSQALTVALAVPSRLVTAQPTSPTVPAAPAPAPVPSTPPPAAAAPPGPMPAPYAAPAEEGMSGRQVAAWLGVGLGGAALVTGGVVMGLSVSKRDELSANCPGQVCSETHYDDIDSYETMRVVSTVAFVGGALLTTTGVILLVTDKSDEASQLSLQFNPHGLALRGRF